MSFNFKEKIDKGEEYGVGGGGDRFKFEKGDTTIRILASSSEPLATHYLDNGERVLCIGVKKGCQYHGNNAPKDKTGKPKRPSVKYLMYVLDRKTNRIGMAFMPYTIVKALSDYQNDSAWSFDDLPMPYDIRVKFDPEAAPAEMYKVMALPGLSDLEPEQLKELSEKKPLDEIADAMKAKQGGFTEAEGEEEAEIKPEDLPF